MKGSWLLNSTMSFILKTCEKSTCSQEKRKEMKVWWRLDRILLKMIYIHFPPLSRQKPHPSGPKLTALFLTSVFSVPTCINSLPLLSFAILSPHFPGECSALFPHHGFPQTCSPDILLSVSCYWHLSVNFPDEMDAFIVWNFYFLLERAKFCSNMMNGNQNLEWNAKLQG